MAPTEAIVRIALTEAHVPAAQRLSDEAQWNQVAADWRMMVRHGHAIGIVTQGNDAGDALVSSALAMPFGPTVAWISMVLVSASQRRKGLASRLMADCIAWLSARGNEAALDATAAGAQVYRPLGFETVRRMTRWQHTGNPAVASGAGLRDLTVDDLTWITPLDGVVFGAPRDFVLRDLLMRGDRPALGLPGQDGFVLARSGRNATSIGPLLAPDAEAAIRLLHGMLARIDGPVFIDIFDDQSAMVAEMQRLGFQRQRDFERMVRGNTKHFGDPARYFAAAGPELG
ncbi:GNAT family N-acetyltransferase [Ferrovibrio sp.]|uniref:GNAT family N-acetyltransferase n=1 Tax=Ferrovibrio sp. TaxID=1917215 RepID=UPI0035B4C2EE